mmetsp:Transcript_21741/g.40384  ORF Transcript_21741/g.40384 Transcript_21741/m.40384 type:complete len:1398 (+) Transcript_21741:86-4279(+)
MRVCTSALESRCESEEPSWLQAVQRKPGGWLVVLVLSAYIAADKANFWGWHSLAGAKSQASWGALDAGAKGHWQSTANEEQAWLRPDNASFHFRKLETVQDAAAAGSSSAANTTASSSESTSSSESKSKPHDALLFLIVGMIIGTAVTFLASFPLFHGIQQSVALFVIGGLLAIILEGSLSSKEQGGVVGSSFNMWMEIDPHLILFTLLPALLTGDAMTLDTQVARRVASQCVYLASSGVLCNTLLAALFLYVYLPYDWSFLQCMTTGAILCATDPVAVVALLKELGASPTLTVQIQGESLLNDGTAMVLYAISYSMLQGVKYDAYEIMIYLLQKVALAVVIGMVVGYVFVLWIRNTSQLQHTHAGMIQISLTICCAYWSFIISEGVLKINGVLATVFAALVLAHQMWPAIIHKESMHTVWHTLEYLGNTIIFFLAGALTGKSSMYVSWKDYLHVIVIWITLMLIRGLVLYLSRPVLKMLNEDKQSVTPAEAIVITWGGLRGALGLALAIQVTIDRAGGAISQQDAGRALFYVGGVAALTLIINATTCPMIVKKLGITRLEEEKRRMLLLMHRRLIELAAMKSQSQAVTCAIERMLVSTHQSINKDRRKRALDQAMEKLTAARGRSVHLMRSLGSTVSGRGSSRATMMASPSTVSPASLAPGAPLGRLTERMSQENSYQSVPWRNERLAPIRSSADGDFGYQSENSAHLKTQNSLAVAPQPPASVAWASEGHKKIVIEDEVAPNKNACEGDRSSGFNRLMSADRIHLQCQASVVSEMYREKEASASCCGGRCAACVNFEAVLDYVKVEEPAMQPMSDLLDEYAEVKMKFNMIPQESLKLIGDILAMPIIDMEQDHPLMNMMTNSPMNEALLRALNEGFFACLRSIYYKLMETGDIRPGSDEADVLLNSISMALHASYKDLLDFSFVSPFIWRKFHAIQDVSSVDDLSSAEAIENVLPQWTKKNQKKTGKTRLHRLVESLPFHILMITAIIVNAGFMVIEEEYRTSDNDSNPGWLIAEITFCVIFLIECTFKIADQHARFFCDLWNNFDLLLVILGIAGLVFNIVALNLPVDSSQGRVVRVARVFRVMRLIRLFRLVRLMQGLTAILLAQQEALEAQEHIKKIQVLTSFVKAHCTAQNEFVKYFGISGNVDTVEVARVILQSQVSVYKAISMAIGEEHLLDDVLLEQVNVVRESKVLAEELERFVMDAYKGGVVSHREADALLEPVREHIKECYEEIRSPLFIFTRKMKKRGQNIVGSVLSRSRSSLQSLLSSSKGINAATGQHDRKLTSTTVKSRSVLDPDVERVSGSSAGPMVGPMSSAKFSNTLSVPFSACSSATRQPSTSSWEPIGINSASNSPTPPIAASLTYAQGVSRGSSCEPQGFAPTSLMVGRVERVKE